MGNCDEASKGGRPPQPLPRSALVRLERIFLLGSKISTLNVVKQLRGASRWLTPRHAGQCASSTSVYRRVIQVDVNTWVTLDLSHSGAPPSYLFVQANCPYFEFVPRI